MRYIILLNSIIINFTARLLSPFFKKDYNIWLFAFDDGGGSSFCENCWFLYKYVSEKESTIKAICISNQNNNIAKIRDNGGVLVKPNSLKMLMLILKAGVYICEQNMHSDFINFSKKKTFKVNLWHGMIVKKIGYASNLMMKRMLIDNESRTFLKRIKDTLIGSVDYNEYDFLPCTSENMIEPMKKTFNNNNIHVVGQSRDDYFFKNLNKSTILKQNNLEFASGKKIVSYLPTFRDVRKNDRTYILFQKNRDLLSKLESHDIILMQKNHSYRGPRLNKNNNMYILESSISTQDILFLSDILITDYSSSFIDYLHLNRPIIFYPYDIDEYVKYDRELYFDYGDPIIFPGPKVKNENELFNNIMVFCKNSDNYLKQRETSKKYFHKYSDGKSSQRTFLKISETVSNYV